MDVTILSTLLRLILTVYFSMAYWETGDIYSYGTLFITGWLSRRGAWGCRWNVPTPERRRRWLEDQTGMDCCWVIEKNEEIGKREKDNDEVSAWIKASWTCQRSHSHGVEDGICQNFR